MCAGTEGTGLPAVWTTVSAVSVPGMNHSHTPASQHPAISVAGQEDAAHWTGWEAAQQR